MKRIYIFATTAALLSGCMVGPDYEEASKAVKLPETLTAQQFARDGGAWKDAVPADSLDKGDWWKIFNDAVLDKLLARCAENNPDLASAYYRVEQAREAALMDKSQLYPQLDGHASFARRGTSRHSATYMGEYDNWVAGFGISWDLDLFGRVRSLLDSDVATAQATLCAYRSLMLNLQANVAKTYFAIRSLKAEIEVLERTYEVRKEDTALVKRRVAMDYSTNIDLKRAIQQEHEAAAQLASVRRQELLAENALALLLGSSPAELGVKFEPIAKELPKMPQAVPSQLLERRPDIAAAEREVYAANARIGAAQAAFYPTVSLTANTDLNAQKIEKLINSGSFAWGISPQIYIPIFEAGRNIAQKRVALAAHKETLEKYRSTVITAVKEVEDALVNIKYMADEYREFGEVVKASADVQKMTRVQYDEGYTDYFSVSDAQRIHLTNERQLIVLHGEQFAACVSLIQSLGGGWKTEFPESATDSAGRNVGDDFGQHDILPRY